jgi:uncharacterized protein with von Willebrand factor type A (vWA) domain
MQGRHGGFDPDALEAPLAPLDCLPRGLRMPGIINSLGRPFPRLAALNQLIEALIQGSVPPGWTWPTGLALPVFRARILDLALPDYCRGRPAVAELVLRSLLWHTDRIPDLIDRGAAQVDAILHAADAFASDWRKTSGELDELLFVFGEFGDALEAAHWDAVRGLLRQEGWQEVLRIRRLMEQLPELSAVLRALGRTRPTDTQDESRLLEEDVQEPNPLPARRQREIQVPELPGETVGIHRSSRISRMLACEAALMRHPRLRMVWFARHAERTLLTYEDRDLLAETVIEQTTAPRPARQRRPDRRLESGPMMVCVDTSASMRGGPEQVAKAAVLEALRTAHAQRRACYVFAFSGPGDVVEMDLALDAQGIESAIDLLGRSFHGGTDICEPLERALVRLETDRWHLADLLIASDGEFGATAGLVARVRQAKADLGLRIQGLLAGDRETIGMAEICDDILWIRDWRRFGAGGDSPVHSSRLTALYFPNAMR